MEQSSEFVERGDFRPNSAAIASDNGQIDGGLRATLQSRIWETKDKDQHINLLEMEAIRLVLLAIKEQVRGKVILVATDKPDCIVLPKKGGGNALSLSLSEGQVDPGVGWEQTGGHTYAVHFKEYECSDWFTEQEGSDFAKQVGASWGHLQSQADQGVGW